MRNKLVDVLLFVLAFGLLALLVANSNPLAVMNTLQTANIAVIFGALAVTTTVVALKIARWRLLLESIGIKLGYGDIVRPYMASLFISNITPGRVGEPVRSYYLKKDLGHPISQTLPTVLLERILDISTLAAFYVLGLFVLYAALNKILVAGISFVILLILSVIAVAGNKRLLRLIFSKTYQLFKFIPRIKRLEKRVEKLPDTFHRGFVLASKSRVMPVLVLITFLSWLMEFMTVKLSFLSIGIDIDFATVAAVASVATIIGLLTFLPGNIGSFEATAAFFLAQAVPGMDLATATSGILIYRFSSLWFALLLASKFFLKYR